MVTPEVLVILDGASEPVRAGEPTSLERADTPTLDALAERGALSRVQTVPDGLVPGSEVAIPVLLGWTPIGPVDRGAVEAAAQGVPVPDGERAWRIDVRCPTGGRASAVATARAADVLRHGAPRHVVHPLGGHRLLLVGSAPLPDVALAGRGLRVWPGGLVPPATLDEDTGVVIAAAGAAAGVARLLGARTVVPAGATGLPDSDLLAKVAAARAGLRGGYGRVVVHAGGADEAGHQHDAAAKVAFLERADRELIAPLADAVRAAGGVLRVLPDHGCDPATGAHDALPVPCLTWRPTRPNIDPARPGAGTIDVRPQAAVGRRLTERAVADVPLTDLTKEPVLA